MSPIVSHIHVYPFGVPHNKCPHIQASHVSKCLFVRCVMHLSHISMPTHSPRVYRTFKRPTYPCLFVWRLMSPIVSHIHAYSFGVSCLFSRCPHIKHFTYPCLFIWCHMSMCPHNHAYSFGVTYPSASHILASHIIMPIHLVSPVGSHNHAYSFGVSIWLT